MNREIPSFLLENGRQIPLLIEKGQKIKMTFIDRTIKSTFSFIWESILQYELSLNRLGFQRLSSTGILIFFLIYIVCINLTHSLYGHLIFAALIFGLLLTTSIRLSAVYVKAIILSFLFGFLVMVPACLNIFAPGEVVLTLARFQSEKKFLIYHLPEVVGITYEGIVLVLRMFFKVFNSVSLTFLVIYSVPFERLMKSLRLMKVPSIFILIITMSYKFIYTMALTIEEMYLALKSRWIGNFSQDKTRHIIAGRMGFLFRKSYQRYEEVYKAMISRGFTGDVIIKTNEKIKLKEACLLIVLIGAGVIISILKF